MSYINTGAYVDGARPRTKKALKEAVKDAPHTVTFDGTSPLSPDGGRNYRADEVPAGHVLVVCGPDPYIKRNWWANVKLKDDGSLTVS
jgi:hypothetical protein